jgi:amino acid adenylation domain-containing protein
MSEERSAQAHTVLSSQHLREEKYWLETLRGQWEVCGFPPQRLTGGGERSWEEYPFTFNPRLTEPLMRLRNGSDPRLHMILEAAVAVLLHIYTSMEDIIIGMPALKQDVEADFVNTVMPLRHRVDGSMTFKQILLETRQQVVEAIENQNYPVTMLPHLLERESGSEDFPIFDVAVLLDNIHDPRFLDPVRINMIFSFSRQDNGVGGVVGLNGARYSQAAAVTIVSHLERLLEAVLANVDAAVEEIEILSPRQREQLLHEFIRPSRPISGGQTLWQLCRSQGEKNPDAVALKGGRIHVTYSESNRRAAHIAGALRERGVKSGEVIALCIDRSLHMIDAILGVLAAGCAYLPIDPTNPADNIRYILNDSNAALVLTAGEPEAPFPKGLRSMDIRELDREPRQALSAATEVGPHDPAYVIYTSGTTGRPKGVLVEHGGAVNTLQCRRAEYNLTAADVSLQLFAYSFDGFVTSFFTPYISGTRTILLSSREVTDISCLRQSIVQEGVTCMISVPSFFQVIIENLSPNEAASLKVATLAGDKIPAGLPELAARKNPHLELVNEYGVTELSVMSTIGRGMRPGTEQVIGVPAWNTTIYIVDRRTRLTPPGVPGELVIGGAGVARGYVNRPELTAERFIPDPFAPGDICYRTGDRGRWLEDGSIELLGRMDHQLKIRCYRIEPGEIEQHILQSPQVADVAVTARANDRGDRMLVAFVVPVPCGNGDNGGGLDLESLRGTLNRRLPDHMIPAHFVEIETIPLTSVGKTDRKALATIPLNLSLHRRVVPPRTDTEQRLATIWREMLGVEEISVTDNFFNIGGDSIKTISLLNQVSAHFDVKLEILDLYEHETIEKLALRIDSGERDADLEPKDLDARRHVDQLKERIIRRHNLKGVEDLYPISDIQTGLIFYGMKNTAAAQYHIQFVYPIITDEFDFNLLERALELLAQKHTMLRTSFNLADYEEPVQLVHKDAVLDIEDLDISGLEVKEQEDQVKMILRKDRDTPFDIGALPLWRMKSIRLAPGRICLVSTLHHVIGDGWGSANFMTELNNTYLELKQNPDFGPAPLKSDYKEFVIQQLTEKQNPATAEFWRRELVEYKRLDFFASSKDDERPTDMQSFQYQLGKELLAKIKEKAFELDTNIKHLSFAAYNFVIKMLSYEQDIVVGLLTNNRPAGEDGDKIFGCFLNTVPVRLPIEADLGWKDYVRQVDRKMMEIKKYDRLSLFEIARVVGEKAQDGNPFFDTLFNFVDFHVYQTMDIDPTQRKAADQGPGPDPYRDFYVPGRQDTNTFFDFEVNTTAGEFMICVKYNQAAISEIIAQRCCRYFEQFLLQVLEHPADHLDKNALFPQEERLRILQEFNDTAAPFDSHKTMHGLFEEQAERTPEATAVEAVDQTLTYGELESASNRLAHLLMSKGVAPGSLVAVTMDRSSGMIQAVMAILKAGAAYVPLEPYLPDTRIARIMASLQIEVMVTRDQFLPKIQRMKPEVPSLASVVSLDREEEIEAQPDRRPDVEVPSTALAYVIFTSGSTGTPKGVMEAHRPAVNVIQWVNKTFEVGRGDRLLFIVSLGFDLSVYDIFGMLASGGSVFVASEGEIREPKQLLDILLDKGITFWDSAPAALQQLSPFFSEAEERGDGNRLRLVFLSGDWIPVPLPDMLKRAFLGVRVISLGGATEATIWSNYYSIGAVNPDWPSIPYGKPIQNAKYYILDRRMHVCPIGVAGDLYIGGQCLASGYINDEQLTAAKFLPNPFVSGEIIYKTGDVARWFEDGNMEFLGRKDHQVKIRGFRIELGEIEAQLLAREGVEKGLVMVRKDANKERYLCAYFVADAPLDPDQLRLDMGRELPEYMLPAHFVQLTDFPLTANGKVDRGALPEPSADTAREYVAPKNELEERLVKIWADVLGKESAAIGTADDFFESGGHSLNAAVVISRVHKALDVKVPLAQLFRNPTIHGLAASIRSAQSDRFTDIQPAEERAHYPLSAAQKRLFILQQMDRGSTVYNLPVMHTLKGDVDGDKIETAFRRLLERHPALRSSFHMAEGTPVQRIHSSVDFTLRRESGDDSQTAATAFIQPFDLSQAPQLRALLYSQPNGDCLLAVDIHHIVADGISMEIITRDFAALYQGQELPPPPLDYKDYSQWQQSPAQQEIVARQEGFWKGIYAGGIPTLELPTDFPRPEVKQFAGNSLSFQMGEAETAGLEALATGSGLTMFLTLLAAYTALLSKWADQEDIVVGTAVAGRNHAALQQVVGMFVNTLALRFRVEEGKPVRDHLEHIKTAALEAFQNQDLQFEDLVERLEVKRDTGRNPLFDVMFTMQNQQPGQRGDSASNESEHPLMLGAFDYQNTTAKFDLNLQVTVAPKRLYFTLEYATSLFKPATAQRLCDDFSRLAAGMAAAPDRPLSELEIITEEEKKQVLAACNVEGVESPERMTICRRLAAITEQFPHNIALSFEDNRQCSYAFLQSQTRSLAERLRDVGAGPGTIVALLLTPSWNTVPAALAVLEAGACYLPIDPAIPLERQLFLLNDSNAVALVTAKDQSIPQSQAVPVILDGESLPETSNETVEARPEDPAYIIYTSGTTGRPKGVVVEHRNVCALMLHKPFPFDFGAGDIWTMFHSYSFDFSVWEMYGALLFGGRLLVAPPATIRDPRAFGRLLERRQVTVLNQTPSAFYTLSSELLSKEPPSLALRYVIFGGEALNPKRLEPWHTQYPGIRLINMYGITETTVHVTYKEIGPSEMGKGQSNIGKPLAHLFTQVTDRHGNLRPPGMPGQLLVGGAGVARGYLNRPELTAERFTPHYRSGDMARPLENGDLIYLGRRDRQVKIRGYRIETAEVESAVLQHPDVRDVVVSVRSIGGHPSLVAYFVAAGVVSQSQLREFLARRIPAYMMPAHLEPVLELYLTANGKIDRQRLDRIPIDAGKSKQRRPQGRTQEMIAAAWSDVLEREEFDIDDNFFDSGGNSLSLVHVNHRLRNQLELEIPVMAMFEHPTIQSLAAYIQEHMDAPPDVADRSQAVKNARRTRQLQFDKRRKRN